MAPESDKLHFKQTTDLQKHAELFHQGHTLLSTVELAALKGICMKKSECESISTKTLSTSKDKWSSSIVCAELLTYLYLYSVMSKKKGSKNKHWESNHLRFDTLKPVVEISIPKP